MGGAVLRQDGRVSADDEILISVDIEASGPTPSTGSLIAIGACLVEEPARAIYLELRPLPGPWSERAERVHRLSRSKLERDRLEPSVAMEQFADWVADVSVGRRAVFVGWNAGYDWMFTADYFERFLGRNPFGIAPLDIKAYLMGRDRLSRWADTRRSVVAERYGEVEPLTHNALDDARQQAEFIRRLLQQDDQPA
jgi:ribonuclease T